MKKWNTPEVIVLDINETANGPVEGQWEERAMTSVGGYQDYKGKDPANKPSPFDDPVNKKS